MRNCPNNQMSLEWCEGMPQYPGIRRRVYFCRKSLIVAWPRLKKDSTGHVATSLLKGEFVLAEGAHWQVLDINAEKTALISEPAGPMQLNKATFVHNGIDEEATTAAAMLRNGDYVFVYEDMMGHFRVIGNKVWPTVTTVSQNQGQGNTPAATTINVEATDFFAPPFYNGPVTTEDGDVYPHEFVIDPNQGMVVSNEFVTLKEGGNFYSEVDELFLDVWEVEGQSDIVIEEDYITIIIE